MALNVLNEYYAKGIHSAKMALKVLNEYYAMDKAHAWVDGAGRVSTVLRWH